MSNEFGRTPHYLLSEFQRTVEDEIRRVLETPSLLPKEFLAFIGPYIQDQAIQIPKSQVIGLASAEIPTGVIVAYGAATAPTGWIICDGSAVSRSDQALLFNAIGTTYGSGDGSTTFNVPDLRQRFPMGKAASGTGVTLGGTGGNIDHTHTTPNHTHTVSGSTGNDNNSLGSAFDPGSTPISWSLSPHQHAVTGTAASGGAGTTGTANPPFQVVTYIIKAV